MAVTSKQMEAKFKKDLQALLNKYSARLIARNLAEGAPPWSEQMQIVAEIPSVSN